MSASKAVAAVPVESADPAQPFDPNSLPIRSLRGGGAKYLDVKYRLVWLREEHPNAIIETEERGHEPGKWATFRAAVSIPGGGSATGHGSETASDFGDYYEKSETKALGRALAALGYGAQFLPDDGESLADSPTDTPPGAPGPTPINAAQAKASRRFHAVGSSHGWTDRALHLIAVGVYPTHGETPTKSRNELTAKELDDLSNLIEKTIGRMVNQGTGEIIPTPEVDYANAIGKATDQPTLDAIADKLKEGGISRNWLKAMWKQAQFEILTAAVEAGLGNVAPATSKAKMP